MYGNDIKILNDKQTTEIWVSRLKGRDGYIKRRTDETETNRINLKCTAIELSPLALFSTNRYWRKEA